MAVINLILGSLLIGTVLADCPPPPLPKNTEIIHPMGSYQPGARVQYGCKLAYRFRSSASSAQHELVCNGTKTWEHVGILGGELGCEPINTTCLYNGREFSLGQYVEGVKCVNESGLVQTLYCSPYNDTSGAMLANGRRSVCYPPSYACSFPNELRCHPAARCIVTEVGPFFFRCQCGIGKTGDGYDDGTGCTVNTCRVPAIPAHATLFAPGNAATLFNYGSRISYRCNPGYQFVAALPVANAERIIRCLADGNWTSDHDHNGMLPCEDIDECSTNTHTCHATSICSNTAGSFSCSCPSGFTGNGVFCLDCPPTWNAVYSAGTGSVQCLKFSGATTMNYSAAEKHCNQDMRAHLVHIHDSQFNTDVRQLTGKAHSWIGLDDRVTDHAFRWIDNNHELSPWLSQALFRPLNPDNWGESEHCVHQHAGDGKWNDILCSKEFAFTCEITSRPWRETCDGQYEVIVVAILHTANTNKMEQMCRNSGSLLATKPFSSCAQNLARAYVTSLRQTAPDGSPYQIYHGSHVYPVICTRPTTITTPSLQCFGTTTEAYFPVLPHGGYAFGPRDLLASSCPKSSQAIISCAGALMHANNLGHHYYAVYGLADWPGYGIHICFRAA